MTRNEIQVELEQGLKNFKLNNVIELNEKIDSFFQIEFEKSLNLSDESLYPDIKSDALSTSYLDYYQILKDLEKDSTLIDLGAGYCRGSLISALLDLPVCVSIEVIKARSRWARNWLQKNNVKKDLVRNFDLRNHQINYSKAYYFYFPKGKLFNELLKQIFYFVDQGKEVEIYVCEAHGDVIPYLNSFQRLEEIKRFKSYLPRHSPDIIKYQVNPRKEKLTWKNCLAEFLLNEHPLNCFIFHYHSKILNEVFEWIVPMKELELVQLEQEKGLQKNNGRMILIDRDESILDVQIIDLPMIKLGKNEKFLRQQGQWFKEDSFGQIKALKWDRARISP